jgi:tRNA(fMet)-specific endonuclease VapC
MTFTLDTNAVSALLLGNPAFLERLERHSVAEVTLSTIVTHELFYGACHGARRDDTLRRIGRLPFARLSFTDDDARHAGQVRAALRARGTPIGPYDVLIAGQALARGLVLVTHNVAEFSRVEGLSIEDWER